MRAYVWNARLCEEFYLPMQTAEVCVRNAIAGVLVRRFTANWFDSRIVQSLLTEKYRSHLDEVVKRERRNQGQKFTGDHVISGLSFGFWVNLMTARYEKLLWQQGLKRNFEHAPDELSLADAHLKIDQLRRFRNKVAHHFAIYDRSPTSEYRNLLEVLSWISPTAVWFVKQMSNPARVISSRPD